MYATGGLVVIAISADSCYFCSCALNPPSPLPAPVETYMCVPSTWKFLSETTEVTTTQQVSPRPPLKNVLFNRSTRRTYHDLCYAYRTDQWDGIFVYVMHIAQIVTWKPVQTRARA